MGDEIETVVIDNGSRMYKAGFTGDEAPRSVFSSVVGHPMYDLVMAGGQNKDYSVGDEACARAAILNMEDPIKRGIVTNWDNMDALWHHIFRNELRIDPAEHPVLLTEVSPNPKANRERIA
jgi:actin